MCFVSGKITRVLVYMLLYHVLLVFVLRIDTDQTSRYFKGSGNVYNSHELYFFVITHEISLLAVL